MGSTARVALLLFVVTLLTRVPFQTEHLWAHDSVLYERAVERFDPFEQRPQAPGYLYYVLLIRAVDALTGDANRAMTLISLFADAAAVALLYLLARRMYDARTGLIAALFLMSAVTFWAYAGLAYPYTVLAALSIACALALWRAAVATQGRAAALAVASCVIGIAIGFRSDLAIFLAPVWLVAAWGTPLVGWIGGITAGVALVALWYIASAAMDGGVARFASAVSTQGQYVEDTYSVFGRHGLAALGANAYEFARYLGRGLYFLAPLLPLAVISDAARRIELADRRRLLFLLAWTGTPLLIYIPIHSGEYGYVFSMLPGLSVIAARGAIALARGLRMPRTLPWIVAAVVVANSAIFLLSETPLSANDVRRHDLGVAERYDYLASDPDLGRATIVAAYDAEVAARYGLGHEVVRHDPSDPPIEFTFGSAPCAAGVGALQGCAKSPVLAVWDDLMRVHGEGWQTVTMPHGALLRVARNATGARVTVDGLDVTLQR